MRPFTIMSDAQVYRAYSAHGTFVFMFQHANGSLEPHVAYMDEFGIARTCVYWLFA